MVILSQTYIDTNYKQVRVMVKHALKYENLT